MTFLRFLIPGLAVTLIGVTVGLGIYTFQFAKGAAYLSNDPQACANCHVMQDYLSAWQKGSHHTGAVCNDCHTPANVVGKYLTKAVNGYNHSVAFTFNTYQDNLRATALNRWVAERSCAKCHQAVVSTVDTHGRGETSCTRCHGEVGHPR